MADTESVKVTRDNPPASIVTEDELDMYQTLLDDITASGASLQFEDRHALGELAASLVDMAHCRNVIREGTTAQVQGDRNVVTKPKPEVAMLQKLQVHVKAMFREFNLTPNSRGSKGGKGGASGENDGFGKI